MPTYYPLQTKVQLHTSTLAETTTSAPERRKGPYATYKTDKAAMKIQNGRVLKETPIAIDDDESRLHFIGPNSEVPFFLMHAGEDNSKPPGEETVVERALRKLKLNENRPRKPLVPSFSTMSTLTSLDPDEVFSEPEHDEEDVAGDSTPRASRAPSMTPSQFALELEKRRSSPVKGHRLPAGISSLPAALPDASTVPTNQHSLRHGPAIQAQDPTLTPQALGLSFSFSDKSFLRSFDKQDTLQDVKIDVYVNGDFTESTTVPARQVVENKSKVTRGAISQIITGKRIHHMVERAWVLVPPHQNADGSMRPRNRSRASLAGPEERWNQVNAAILDEADKLGFNNRGERSPVGAYLASLAALPMPAAVEEFQKAGGPKFGVIDIAISVGIGRKFGPTASYLMEPTRMTDKEFVPRPADDPGVGSDVPAADTSAS
jgi:hypothetical protein